MADVLDVLGAIKESERSTKAMMEAFPEWSDRAFASKMLGNMRNSGLIQKRSNGYWALTKKGKQRLDGVSSVGKAGAEPDSVNEQEGEIVPVPTKATPVVREALPQGKPSNALQLLEKLQDQVPENASLVIERNDLFFVVAGQKFEIRWPGDFEAMTLVADRYIGQVA